MDFDLSHRLISPIQHELDIELPWDEVEKRIQTVLTESRDVVEIDGFRKGKAPLNLIRQHLGEKKVLERAAELAAREAFSEASKTLEKKPLTPPEYNLGEIKPNEPLKFTARYYIEPPNPQELAMDIARKNMPEAVLPSQATPPVLPNIQSHGPYSVSPDILRKIPALNLADGLVPNPLPQAPNPQSMVPDLSQKTPEIPDPQQLAKPPDIKPDAAITHGDKESALSQNDSDTGSIGSNSSGSSE